MGWLVVASAIGAYWLGLVTGWYRGYLAHPDDQCGQFLRERMGKIRDIRRFSGLPSVSTSEVTWNGETFAVVIEHAQPSAPLLAGKQEEE